MKKLLVAYAACLGVFFMYAAWAVEGADETPVRVLPGRHQLFLDDALIASKQGVVSVMHTPEKRGAVLRPDIPPDGPLIQTRMEPVWCPEDSTYRMLYYAYGGDADKRTGMALATSKDGRHWEKPVLGLVSLNGSKQNNWIPPVAEPPNNAIDGVVYDPDEPNPERRFKALVGAINRKPYVSGDFIHWTPLGTAEIPSSDESHLALDVERHIFLAMVKTNNEYGRAFGLSTSTDFEHWTPRRMLFGADAEDQRMAPGVIRRRLANPAMLGPLFVEPMPQPGAAPGPQPVWRAEVYNIGVFPYEDVYLGLPSLYYPTGTCLPAKNNTDGFHEIQLVMSRDLEHWVRLGERKPFIPPSDTRNGLIGVYDRTQLLAANRPLVREKELWFYYSALKWRDDIYGLTLDGTPRDPGTLSPEDKADQQDGWGAICLAVLRRDGFVSLHAGEEGVITTKPILAGGKHLYLNAAAKGSISVEVLGRDGGPLPGYAEKDSVPVTTDDVRLPVKWKGSDALPDTIPPQASDAAPPEAFTSPVCLRIHLKNADLYSFWVE